MQETQETQVWSLAWEDPLEEGMATCCSILAWRIPWTEEPGGLQSMGLQRVRHDWAQHIFILSTIHLRYFLLSKEKASEMRKLEEGKGKWKNQRKKEQREVLFEMKLLTWKYFFWNSDFQVFTPFLQKGSCLSYRIGGSSTLCWCPDIQKSKPDWW